MDIDVQEEEAEGVVLCVCCCVEMGGACCCCWSTCPCWQTMVFNSVSTHTPQGYTLGLAAVSVQEGQAVADPTTKFRRTSKHCIT